LNKLIGQEVGRAGIGRVKLKDWLADENVKDLPEYTSGGWHHMGTTRMSDDPKTGVVDAECKVHGINNLFVASSSCFPTGGAVNPTLTVVAMSLRLAAHLKQKMSASEKA
jgi:choline dehydrogenase-like flavoprotein